MKCHTPQQQQQQQQKKYDQIKQQPLKYAKQ